MATQTFKVGDTLKMPGNDTVYTVANLDATHVVLKVGSVESRYPAYVLQNAVAA